MRSTLVSNAPAAGDGRRLLVLDVVPFLEEDEKVPALLEVEELPPPA
jgi:hypothetical protein